MHLLDLFSVSCFVHVDVFSLPHVCCFLMYAFFSSKFGRSFLYFTFCTSNLVSLPCVCCFLMYAFFFFPKLHLGICWICFVFHDLYLLMCFLCLMFAGF
jgi:hypothetical protein